MSRFPIKRSKYWIPLLVAFGATERNSYLDIGPERIAARLGMKRVELPRENVEYAERSKWPWWAGIGWRSDLRRSIGLIGATSPVIRIHCRPHRDSLLGIPLTLTDLYVSVDDADAVLAELPKRENPNPE